MNALYWTCCAHTASSHANEPGLPGTAHLTIGTTMASRFLPRTTITNASATHNTPCAFHQPADAGKHLWEDGLQGAYHHHWNPPYGWLPGANKGCNNSQTHLCPTKMPQVSNMGGQQRYKEASRNTLSPDRWVHPTAPSSVTAIARSVHLQ